MDNLQIVVAVGKPSAASAGLVVRMRRGIRMAWVVHRVVAAVRTWRRIGVAFDSEVWTPVVQPEVQADKLVSAQEVPPSTVQPGCCSRHWWVQLGEAAVAAAERVGMRTASAWTGWVVLLCRLSVRWPFFLGGSLVHRAEVEAIRWECGWA